MKNLIIVSVLAAAFAGCQKEAEKFGYIGADLEDEDQLYLTVSPAVTNWLPARVLSVNERYEFSEDEKALVAAAGVVWSGEPLKAIPEGFASRDKEPWFQTWVKTVEAFGRHGTSGFLSHFDEDRGEWEVGETFFSTYWDTMGKAKAALAELEKKLVEGFHPLKIHRIAEGFLAEYRRMRVIAVAGPRANKGDFACMLSFQDKNRAGCGPWEPVADQEERVRTAQYMKALKAWRADAAKVVSANHAKVEELRKVKGLQLFGDDANWFDSGDGSYMCYQSGQFDTTNTAAKAFIEGKVAEVAKATGAAFAGEISGEGPQGEDGSPMYYSAEWKGDLYSIRVDVAASGEWRMICSEVLQPGFELPKRP